MKTLFVAVSLAFALIAVPASAQLGPAGVPGAPGLAETDPSVKPNPPAPPPTVTPMLSPTPQQKAKAAPCSKAKNVEQCMAREAQKNKARAACKGKTGAAYQQCTQQQRKTADCSKSSDPARCEQHKKAAELCKNKPAAEHRQCLRDILAPKK